MTLKITDNVTRIEKEVCDGDFNLNLKDHLKSVKNLEYVVPMEIKELFMLKSMKRIKHYIQYK